MPLNLTRNQEAEKLKVKGNTEVESLQRTGTPKVERRQYSPQAICRT